VILWLHRAAANDSEQKFDVCLRLDPHLELVNLHEAFSVMLTSPRLRSLAFYWNEQGLEEDLRVWRGGRTLPEPATPFEDIASIGYSQARQYIESKKESPALPVAAFREAQTLLKRQAGNRYVISLNISELHRHVADELREVFPNVFFSDFSRSVMAGTVNAGNLLCHGGCGLDLHQRMAMVQASDAYVGNFDELGCAAAAFGKPCVLFGQFPGSSAGRIECGVSVVLYPDGEKAEAIAEGTIQFLRRHLLLAEERLTVTLD
jgi:hypothetical protein